MTLFAMSPEVIFIYICLFVGFGVGLYADYLGKKLKHNIDRQKIIELDDMAVLYKNTGSPPLEILSEKGISIFKMRRNILIAGMSFLLILPSLVLFIKCGTKIDCFPSRIKCKESELNKTQPHDEQATKEHKQ